MTQEQTIKMIWRAYRYKGVIATLELIEKLYNVGPYTAQCKLAELTGIEKE